MRTRHTCLLLCASLAGAAVPLACRAVDGLGGLTFDVGGTGGGAAGCTCVDQVPAGWSGPVAVYEGPPGTSPACPGEYPVPVLEGGTGLDASPATCGACTCGAPPVTCSPGAVAASTHWGCNGGKQTVTPVAGNCAAFSPAGDYFVEDPPSFSVGPCPPAGGATMVPPLAWAKEAVVCGRAASGPICPGGGTPCAPPPPAPFEARTCIWRSGMEQPCPAQFPQPRGWASAVDQRGCAPCVCSSPSPVTCTVTTTLFSDTWCKTALSDAGVGSQCEQHPGVQSLLADTSLSASPICTPDGGSPTGAASPELLLTVCCAP